MVQTSYLAYEEMGARFTESLGILSLTKTEEIEEQFARLEETFKDEITSAVIRSYAQMVATLTPEINRVRKIQDYSATKICWICMYIMYVM